MKTRAQLQQEHEAMPIEEHDPFACDCERCVREQIRRVNEREAKVIKRRLNEIFPEE